ncbi:MAG: hypothetical protein QXN05_01840 [Acidilobaceae archaeon]
MRNIIAWAKCDVCGRVTKTYPCSSKRTVLNVCAFCGIALEELSENLRCTLPFKTKRLTQRPRLEPDAEVLRRFASLGDENTKKKREKNGTLKTKT